MSKKIDKKKESEVLVDFKNVTPKMLMDRTEPSPLYKKAFLDCNEPSESEFAQNTTTWD